MRKKALSDEEILDHELVHSDKPHRLFFWVKDIYVPYLDEFSALLTKWLSERLGSDPKISVDKFDNRYIIVCSGAIVKSYADKIKILEKFRKTLPDLLSGVLAEYILQERDTYEKIPSIANSLYENNGTAMLKANNYQLTKGIFEQIAPLIPCSVEGQPILVQINIMGDVNITNAHTPAKTESLYQKFVLHILSDKPKWFISGEWLSKNLLVEKFNEKYEQSITLRTLMWSLHSENLFNQISAGEKRIKRSGKFIRVFLAK